MSDYDQRYPKWRDKMSALFERKRQLKSDIEHLRRDAIAVRLDIANAKLNLADTETKITEHRKTKPCR